MNIGLFTMPYMRLPLEKAFSDAKRLGYDGVEVWGGRPHAYASDLKAGGIREVKELAGRYGLPIIGYTPETNAYPYNMMIGSEAMRRDSLEYIKLSMDMAVGMGGASRWSRRRTRATRRHGHNTGRGSSRTSGSSHATPRRSGWTYSSSPSQPTRATSWSPATTS